MNSEMVPILAIASDHAGFPLKKKLLEHLNSLEMPCLDLGTRSEDSVDYPDYANLVCEWWHQENSKKSSGKAKAFSQAEPGLFGILICGSGQGMAMRANKYPDIRAALCWNIESARLAREHNDANVLCLAGRLVDASTNLQILETFLNASFLGGRHEGRVQKIGLPPTTNC